MRVPRTAAGRRALQLALLVGGLFVLGFLCGEQAHAADGTPLPAKVTSVRPGVAGHADGDPVRAVRELSDRPVRVVRTVTEKVAGPARDVLTTVSRSVQATVTEAAGKPGTPAPSPSLALPGLTHVTDAPVHPAPESTAPRPCRHGGAAAPAEAKREQRHARAQGGTTVGTPAPVVAYGPEDFSAAFSAPQHAAHSFARHGAAAVGAPGRPAPPGDPDGVLGKQAADAGASRHGEAHAVALDERVPVRLVPGATVRAGAPRTRERHRDIPVFPG